MRFNPDPITPFAPPLQSERRLIARSRQTIVVGAYMIVFGLAIALLGTKHPVRNKMPIPFELTLGQNSRFLLRSPDMPLSCFRSSGEVLVSIAIRP